MRGKPVGEGCGREHVLRGARREAPVAADSIKSGERDDAVLEVAGDGEQGVLRTANLVFVRRHFQKSFATGKKLLVLLFCESVRLDGSPDRREIVVSKQKPRMLRVQRVQRSICLADRGGCQAHKQEEHRRTSNTERKNHVSSAKNVTDGPANRLL